MVFLPFFSAEPEKEGRGFKLRPCVSLLSLAVERWETPGHPVTPSYMLICSPQRDQRRNMANYNWWAGSPGFSSLAHAQARAADTVCGIRAAPGSAPKQEQAPATCGPTSLQSSALHCLSAGKGAQSAVCRVNANLQTWKATTASAWGDWRTNVCAQGTQGSTKAAAQGVLMHHREKALVGTFTIILYFWELRSLAQVYSGWKEDTSAQTCTEWGFVIKLLHIWTFYLAIVSGCFHSSEKLQHFT